MAAASRTPEVSLRQLYPGQDAQSRLQEIKDLGDNRFGRAPAASLSDFCQKAVRGLEAFLWNLADFKVFRIGRGPEELTRALQRAHHYLREKCTISGAARLWAIEAAGGQSLVATETEAKDHITEAVRLHVEVVVEAAKANMENADGRPILMARHRATNTQIRHELSTLCDSAKFEHKLMKGFEASLGESKTLDEVWQAIQEKMNVDRCLGRKLDCIRQEMEAGRRQWDYVRKEVEAGRRCQEEDCCPEVFFLVPADTSDWSTLKRFERWQIFTKNMQLFFMCTTFFDEIDDFRASMPMPPEVRRSKLRDVQDECSEFIDIKQPSDFFAKYNRAIKMSILVIQTIGIAAAFFGISVQGVLPSSIGNISDLDDLSDIMSEGLEAAKEAFMEAEEIPQMPEEQQPATQPGSWWRKLKSRMRRSTSETSVQPTPVQPPAPPEAASRMRNDSAHLVMQHYLTKHEVDWKGSVHCKLKLAHNAHHGYTYVCKSDPQHEEKWEQRTDDARGPLRF